MIRCPVCRSENCQRAEVAHAIGTQTLSVRGEVLGVGTGGVGAGWVQARGQSQSRLAEQIAPPVPPTLGCLPLLLLLVSLGLVAAGFAWSWWALPVGILCFVAFVRVAAGDERPSFAEEQAAWKRRWICLKCGEVWDASPTVVEASAADPAAG